ncbi:methyl-accepting chemotaxis protein [Cylindrospermum sp. FACHB-282]|uniref:methyl-accepting chemotaxis protein n=1 Tax=Cylindrospermum sp. FACHB-282 TaxID=2692794 RepID=UPI0016883930|nr:methyl-accepting chemotaxis protein [Cylindrospermum sp. FACHB-282]MBD2386859.1 GAF domain-containing protein [Cylindrospermum sp. FACHB-282]
MFNKTDIAKSSDAQNQKSRISSEKSTDNIVQVPFQTPTKTAGKFPLHDVVSRLQQLSLGTKATILAIAFGTIPALGIGAVAYSFANKSITRQISQDQAVQALSLADNVNHFMFERYGDIQVLANLLFLTNPKVSASTTTAEKQAVLDSFVAADRAYSSVAVFDLEGKVIFKSTGEPLGKDKARNSLQEVLRKGTAVISEPETSKSTGVVNIYIAAPVKDALTGKTIAVVRGRLPVQSIAGVMNNYVANGNEYHLLDASGKVFLSPRQDFLGKEAKAVYPGLANLPTANKVETFKAVQQINQKPELVSYVSSKTIEGLPALNWQVLLSTDTAIVYGTQKQLLWLIVTGTGLTAMIVGAMANWLAKGALQPVVKATAALTKLRQGELNTHLEIGGKDELGQLSDNINQMAAKLESLASEQGIDTQWTKLLADITLGLRRSIKTEDIYQTVVKEVRQALKTDRVIIYQLNPDTSGGIVIAESVADAWPQMFGVNIDDPGFSDGLRPGGSDCYRETYQDSRVQANANIHQEPSLNNADSYSQMLEKFAIKGNLSAPIIIQGQLVGLLMAHQCESPRIWQQLEIDLFKQIAIQVGYAQEQAQLLAEVERARAILSTDSLAEGQQKEILHRQLLELLSDVESAAKGDLTVRADVTSGEIGTVADFFNSIVESLRDIVTQVKHAAIQVNEAIGSNESAIRQLAEEALTQANEINRTLDAVDQMTNSMQAVAESAKQTAVIANHAADNATKSGQAMDLTVQNILSLRETVGETAKKVRRLGESSQQISRVVSLINQIAMQTNLLAINAGIEAARAGEEGQGFAVVAEEVGELAARSAAATQEIEEIVENIQRETSEVVQAMEVGSIQVVEGTRIVEDAKQSLSQILDVSRQIDSLVHSISTATASQVQTSQTVSQLMKDIAAVSQRSSDSSRQVSQSLQKTVEISQELQETVGTFKIS